MSSLLYLALYAAFGYVGGYPLRTLRQPSEDGNFKGKRWAIYGAAILLGLAFARFVINRHGPFGPQPETMLFIGVLLMVGTFLIAVGAFARFK
jgi:hypothetical protein